jgi:YHS domain-containing protein
MTTPGNQATDPVCGMTVDSPSAGASGLTIEHDGDAFYFRGRGCKLEFEDDPGRYLDPDYRPAM